MYLQRSNEIQFKSKNEVLFSIPKRVHCKMIPSIEFKIDPILFEQHPRVSCHFALPQFKQTIKPQNVVSM
jgi:hypothetical protein